MSTENLRQELRTAYKHAGALITQYRQMWLIERGRVERTLSYERGDEICGRRTGQEAFEMSGPSSELERLERLSRRANFLEQRIRARGQRNSSYDAAEASALRWAVEAVCVLRRVRTILVDQSVLSQEDKLRLLEEVLHGQGTKGVPSIVETEDEKDTQHSSTLASDKR